MSTLFISDLHLDPTRPQITELFFDFLRQHGQRARRLYILGDLFEAYLGDDDDSTLCASVAEQLNALSMAGTAIYFIRGNRDFLLGADYAKRCGMQLLSDPSVILIGNEPALIMHGDTLCTDDIAYQAFRKQVRDPVWQHNFLAQPIAARRAFAEQARAASKSHQSGISEQIMDVNDAEVLGTMKLYGVRQLIHGHTHRPAVHSFKIDSDSAQRIVLGDWDEQGSALIFEADKFELTSMTI